MNSVAPTTTTVKPAVKSIAFVWGAQDAAAGKPCVPEMQWIRRSDQCAYAAGWAFVKVHNDTTRYFLGAN